MNDNQNIDNAKTFSKSFEAMKTIAIVCILTVLISTGVMTWCLFTLNAKVGKRVYVVTDGGSFWATEKETDFFNQYEAKNFIKKFCSLMFEHNANTYKSHMDEALPLINGTYGKAIYANYEQSHIYQMYVNYDASTTVTIDSVIMFPDTRPLTGAVFMKIITHRDERNVSNPIAYRFTLDRVDRSESNPYGYYISLLKRIVYNPIDVKVDQQKEEERKAAESKVADSLAKVK